jgi:mono/diheme cytochrome c family protein
VSPGEGEKPGDRELGDEQLLAAHEKLLGRRPDERAHYRMLPLIMLFVFSALILFSATYLNRYDGHFDATVFDETQLPSKGGPAAKPLDPVQLGSRLFHQGTACVTCHQATGLGLPGAYPPLAGSEWVQGPQNRVISIVLYGLQGKVTVKGMTFDAAAMPAFGPSGYNWSNEQIAAVLSFVRQEWGNRAPPISPDAVAAIRSKDGNRGPWAEADLLKIK